MRMWMIRPELMCNKHLLGEHGELHKFAPSFRKQYSVANRISPVVQIELSSYQSRHDELANEMIRRSMNHNSPIDVPDFSYLPREHYKAEVDVNVSIQDLYTRCDDCKVRIERDLDY